MNFSYRRVEATKKKGRSHTLEKRGTARKNKEEHEEGIPTYSFLHVKAAELERDRLARLSTTAEREEREELFHRLRRAEKLVGVVLCFRVTESPVSQKECK